MAYGAQAYEPAEKPRTWPRRLIQLFGLLLVLYALRSAWVEYRPTPSTGGVTQDSEDSQSSAATHGDIVCNVASTPDFPSLQQQMSWEEVSEETLALQSALYPIPQQTVNLYQLTDAANQAAAPPYTAQATTDSAGNVVFPDAPPGLYEVWACADDTVEGRVFADSQHVRLGENGPSFSVSLTMVPAAVKDGRPEVPAPFFIGKVVRQEDHSPVTHYRLQYESPDETGGVAGEMVPEDRVIRNDQGEFMIPWLGDEMPTLTVHAENYLQTRTVVAKPTEDPSQPLVLEVDPGMHLRGRVVNRAGEPLAAANLYPFRGTRRRQRPVGRTAADGSFSIGPLQSGEKKQLFVSAPGYPTHEVTFNTSEYRDKSLEIVVSQGANLEVHATDADKVGPCTAYIANNPNFRRELVDGQIVLEDLPAGARVLVVESPGRIRRFPVDLEEGEEKHFDVEMGSTGTARVAGKISSEGEPPRFFTAELSRSTAQFQETQTFSRGHLADEQNHAGVFEFTNLEPGAYRLTVAISRNMTDGPLLGGQHTPAGFMRQLEFTVEEGGNSEHLIALDSPGGVYGKLADYDPNRRTIVYLMPGHYTPQMLGGGEGEFQLTRLVREFNLFTRARDEFHFVDVAPGDYTLVVAQSGNRDNFTSLNQLTPYPLTVEPAKTASVSIIGTSAPLVQAAGPLPAEPSPSVPTS
jgi:hypothetical protein